MSKLTRPILLRVNTLQPALCEIEIERASTSNQRIEEAVRAALDYLARTQVIYESSSTHNKRVINQSVFEAFFVGREGIVESALQHDFEFLVSDELVAAAREHLSKPKLLNSSERSASFERLLESEATRHYEYRVLESSTW